MACNHCYRFVGIDRKKPKQPRKYRCVKCGQHSNAAPQGMPSGGHIKRGEPFCMLCALK
jgi:hypothetical protein